MPYLLTATPSSPTSWVKMETESVLSGHSEMSNRSRHNLNNLNNKQHRNNYSSHIPKSNLSVNNFPTLPPIPSMPPTLTSLSNYSLSRNHTNLNNQNYYHLGPRTNYSMESPYNTTLSVPISQTLYPGYKDAKVSLIYVNCCLHFLSNQKNFTTLKINQIIINFLFFLCVIP